ncbi:hypothetical protein GlitD10_0977 [Gloeomargarita lithophora Alchichica-D10]|uniref:Polymerase beta nucleotidyltransferase domain-containing protein n=1 Tax=Gloeomargarita lithophora Alchichica-D10 TaxID=1188229 RepID=A0A1J0ABJ2_9CYAN|nr:nucleotidyltransferase domain-containing protein [Gloeomargarita lithophora]APB33295.1 hypothetical protein GlitD10_0977 [Gloeomargarita lithophora Alchichica-D10]
MAVGVTEIQVKIIKQKIEAIFGLDLWAIVIYGSRATHSWVHNSDLDLLVVAENIPNDRSRDDLLLPTCLTLEKLLKFDVNFTLLKPLELCQPISLTYEIGVNHYIVYDKSGFIIHIKNIVTKLINEKLIEHRICRGIPYWTNNNEKEISQRLLSKG